MADNWADLIHRTLVLAPHLQQYPALTTAIAQTPGISDAEIEAVGGLTRANETANWLHSLPGDQRQQEWSRMSGLQRELARRGGFTPVTEVDPEPPVEDTGDPNSGVGGFFRHLGHGIGYLTGGVKTGAGQALESLDAPLDAVQHLQRANQQVALENNAGGLLASAASLVPVAGVLTSPGDFARAWRETRDGERAYDREALADVRRQYDQSTFDLARRRAEGESMAEILDSAKSQPERDLYDAMMRNPVLQEAINAVNNAKLGLGRGLARGVGIDPVAHQTTFKLVSGSLDATNDFFLDPLLVGGKIAKVAKVARLGFANGVTAERLDQVFQVGSAKRWVDGVIPRVNEIANAGDDLAVYGHAFEDLNTNYRRAVPMLTDLVDYTRNQAGGNLDAEGLKQFFLGQKGMAHLLGGEAAVRGVFMPHTGAVASLYNKNLRAGMRGAMKWFERPSEVADRAFVKTVDEMHGGYTYDVIDPRDRIGVDPEGFGAMSRADKFEHARSVKNDLRVQQDEQGAVFQRKVKGEWVPTPVAQVTPTDILNGRVRQQSALRPVAEEAGLLRSVRNQSRLYRIGMAASRFVEADPATRGGTLKLMSNDAPRVVYNLARTYLPRWHANRLAGVFAAADLGGRKNIYTGLVESLAEAAGVTGDDIGRDWVKDYVARLDPLSRGRGYSAKQGVDVAGDGAEHALHEHQFTDEVALPSFKEMHEFAARVGMVSKLGGAATVPALDWFIAAWRPGVLLRPALVFRNALEEVTNHISKYGVWDFSKGVAARHILDPAAKEYAATGMVADIEYRLTHGLGRALLNKQEKQWIREYASNGEALATYLESIRGTSMRGLSNRIGGEGSTERRLRRRGGTQYEVKFTNVGKDFRRQDATGGDGSRRWAGSLRMLLQPGNQAARTALAHIEDRETAVANIADLILSDKFARNRDWSQRWAADIPEALRDDPAAQQAAARKWAEKVYQDVHDHLSNDRGQLVEDLVGEIRVTGPDGASGVNLDAITPKRLDAVPENRRPGSVLAGDTIYIADGGKTGLTTHLIDKGFEKAGVLTGLLGKHNIHFSNYLDARRHSAGWEKQLADTFFEDLKLRRRLTDMTDPRFAAAVEAQDLGGELADIEERRAQRDALQAGVQMPEGTEHQLGDALEDNARARQIQGRLDALGEFTPEQQRFAKKVAKARADADAAAAEHVATQAARTAEMQTLAYVDNPDVRSQASVMLRNIIPFYRAQEEFYRRWARTLRHNPEVVRRLQVAYEGAHSSGFLQKDQDGNSIFIYPGSRQAQTAAYYFGKLIGWNGAMSPIPWVETSQVRFLNQGMDPKNVWPSFGPVAAIPMKMMEKIFPESTQVKHFNRAVLGDQAAGQNNPFASLVPTVIRRMWEANPLYDTEQLTSSTMATLQWMQANGRMPPEGSDPAVIDDAIEHAKQWARFHVLAKAIFGTTAPAAPQELGAPQGAAIGPKTPDDPSVIAEQHRLIDSFRREGLQSIDSQFRAEVARLTPEHGAQAYNIAIGNWMRTRPDDLPYTVGKTEATFGGFIPGTKAAGDFYDSHRDLFDRYPAAAVLFMPQEQSAGDFDMDVYRTELASGLRQRKDLKSFANDLKIAGLLQSYFDKKGEYLQQRGAAKAAGDQGVAGAAQEQWQTASATFRKTHPAVAEYLSSYQKRKNDADRTMGELLRMAENGAMPNIPGREAILALVTAYHKREAALNALPDDRSTATTLAQAQIRSSFQEYAAQVARLDPNADLVYQRLLRGLEDN